MRNCCQFVKWITGIQVFNLFINRLVFRKVIMWFWKTISKRDSHEGKNKYLRGTSAKGCNGITRQHSIIDLLCLVYIWHLLNMKAHCRYDTVFWLIFKLFYSICTVQLSKCFPVKQFFHFFSLILFLIVWWYYNVLVYGFHYSYHLLACLKGEIRNPLFSSLFYRHAEFIELNWIELTN